VGSELEHERLLAPPNASSRIGQAVWRTWQAQRLRAGGDKEFDPQ